MGWVTLSLFCLLPGRIEAHTGLLYPVLSSFRSGSLQKSCHPIPLYKFCDWTTTLDTCCFCWLWTCVNMMLHLTSPRLSLPSKGSYSECERCQVNRGVLYWPDVSQTQELLAHVGNGMAAITSPAGHDTLAKLAILYNPCERQTNNFL